MRQIKIEFIPHADHIHTTIGYWEVEGDLLTIQVSEEMCFANKAAVIFHELIEAFWCISKGVTTAECDEFDDMFEKEYEAGLWPYSVEAGFDKRCPYRKGHVWGSRFEWVVLKILGANKKECDAECNKLMGVVE